MTPGREGSQQRRQKNRDGVVAAAENQQEHEEQARDDEPSPAFLLRHLGALARGAGSARV